MRHQLGENDDDSWNDSEEVGHKKARKDTKKNQEMGLIFLWFLCLFVANFLF